MIDPKLEREIQEVQEFIKLWNLFFRTLEDTTAGAQNRWDQSNERVWDEAKETEFLKLKAQIAFRKQVLLDSLGGDDFGMAKDIKKVIALCPSLDILRSESAIKINTIRGIWHEVFIALNKLVGVLKAKKEKVAGISPFAHRMDKLKKNKALKKTIKLVFILGIIGAVAIFVPWDLVITKARSIIGR